MKFDTAFEKMLLAKGLKNKKFLSKATRTIVPDNFSSRAFNFVWHTTTDYWGLYGKIPKIDVFKIELKKLKIKRIIKKQRYDLVKQLFKITTFSDTQYALDRAREFAEENNYIKASKQILSNEINRDYFFENYVISDYLTKWRERQIDRRHKKDHPEDDIQVPMGIPTLDNKIGGIKKGQMFAIIATTGKGKTTWLINMLYSAVMKNFKVLAIFPENTMTEIEKKLD